MTSMRTKGKSTVVWILLGMLLLGLGGFGVKNFSGGGAGDKIGAVGDTPVTTTAYLHALRAEMASFTQRTGQNMTAEQARQVGLPQQVQARLFGQAALEDQARRLGLSVGDARVAARITEAGAFKGPGGQFDPALYAEVLRREGLTKASFERDVRTEETLTLLQRAVMEGVTAPAPGVERSAAWLLETRDIGWQELTAADLPAPVAAPDDATLRAWYEANAPRFTAPETKKITYAWLTPEMLADTVKLDDAALRDLYQQHIDEYQQPERRMVERLVYPDEAAAKAAKARVDAGSATFEALAAEQGLKLTDVDLGEVTQASLGAAGAPVFALDQPGVVGPVMTDLGPALFSMNAILEPVNVPFETAAPDLRAEAAADAARRQIDDQSAGWEDLLAGGATLEDLTKETPMKLAQIDWTADMAAPEASIAGYPAFRERAAALGEKDFPEIVHLDDGGVFAARLDQRVPPTLIPFDAARDKVLADWTAAETRKRLKALADERKLALMSADDPAAAPATVPPAPIPAAPVPTGAPAAPAVVTQAPAAPTETAPAPVAAPTLKVAAGLSREGGLDGLPADVVTRAFRLTEPGDSEVVEAGDRVFLIRLDKVIPADLKAEDAALVLTGVRKRQTESLRGDLLDYTARGVQTTRGVRLDAAALAAANARLQ